MRIKMSFENKSIKQKFMEGNSKTERILIYIILALICIIILGTCIGAISNKIKNSKTRNDPTPSEIESLTNKKGEELSAFTGLGKIRTSSKPETDSSTDYGTLIVISPWFSYPKADHEFYEELSRKRVLITGIITNYFTSHTKTQLMQITEDKIKADLLFQINGQLSLGKIDQLYFTEYSFIE